jgi:hemerythrin superfamily protein
MQMATRKGKSNGRRRSGTASARKRNGGQAQRQDAIALLKADHRQVEEWFGQFEKTRSDERKRELATRICEALKAHTTIEEEIFYPAFLEATGDDDMHHEAEIEHDGAKKLIAEIEASGPEDDYYDARVSVLSEMIKHHVNEEEKRDGMFAKARQSDMDLEALAASLRARKMEVMGEGGKADRGLMGSLSSRLSSRGSEGVRR